MSDEVIEAQLLGSRLIVWDPKKGSKLYAMGFYGKPVGIPKPKTPDFDVPLTLDLIEGLYLLDKGVIRVVDKPGGREISREEFVKRASESYENFFPKYLVYKALRDSGYVVTPGIKFGCDFAVYEHGPGIDHAPYLVSVKLPGEAISATDIVRAGRLATTVRKKFIIAISDVEREEVRFVTFRWWRA